MNNIFDIEKIKDLTPSKYVLGVDTLDDDGNAYCLMRVSGDNKEVILCKSMKKGDDFDSEVNNLARYFNADLVMTEYGKVVNKPAEDKHFWTTECFITGLIPDTEKIEIIELLDRNLMRNLTNEEESFLDIAFKNSLLDKATLKNRK